MFTALSYLLAKKRMFMSHRKSKRRYEESLALLKKQYEASRQCLMILVNDFAPHHRERCLKKIKTCDFNGWSKDEWVALLEENDAEVKSRINRHNQLIDDLVTQGKFLTEQYLREIMPVAKHNRQTK